MEELKIKRYGWRPSLPDPRNVVADTAGLEISTKIEIGDDVPIFDQGQLGSCTANAANRAARIWARDLRTAAQDIGDLSRLETYWGERKIEGTLAQGDTGAQGHDAFKWLQKRGAAPERLWPYEIDRFEERPPAEALDYPDRLTIGRYVHPAADRLLEGILRMLGNGQTVIFGFSVFSSFESAEVAESGIVPIPERGESLVGGHEVLISGCDEDSHPGYLRCDNSWGSSWGDAGRFWMPVSYVTNWKLASDFRTIVIPAG